MNRIVAALLTLALTSPAVADDTSRRIVGQVRHVHDGDTFFIGERKIRLWGMDAPEVKQTCGNARGNRYACGVASRDFLSALTEGIYVSCIQRGTSGNRIVASCEIDGEDIGGSMVRAGHAVDAPKYSNRAYSSDENKAKRAGVGLWQGDFVKPWLWRAKN